MQKWSNIHKIHFKSTHKGYPIIEPTEYEPVENWIGLNEVMTYKGDKSKTGVYFFLDDHYIDIIEQENTELKSKVDALETDNYNANCNLALITGKLDKAIDLLRQCQSTYLRDPEFKIEVERFLKENK